jgi:hypothetical protein
MKNIAFMDIAEAANRIDSAIHKLIEEEFDILKRGLNELNLNAHLAKYLMPLFGQYDVDPEYNGDIFKPNDRKALNIARNRMVKIGIKPNEVNNYQLTPDIIIHKRNSNEQNLVVLEIKKDSNSQKNKDFDLLKLEHLTIDYLGNHYNYRLGVALIFGTQNNAGRYEIKYFQNGMPTGRNSLK